MTRDFLFPQGAAWQGATVHVGDPKVRFARFVAWAGLAFEADVGIDDVGFSRWSTSSPTLTPPPTSTPCPSAAPSPLPSPLPTTALATTEAQLRGALAVACDGGGCGAVALAADVVVTKCVALVGTVGLVLNGGSFALDGAAQVHSLVCYSAGKSKHTRQPESQPL